MWQNYENVQSGFIRFIIECDVWERVSRVRRFCDFTQQMIVLELQTEEETQDRMQLLLIY